MFLFTARNSTNNFICCLYNGKFTKYLENNSEKNHLARQFIMFRESSSKLSANKIIESLRLDSKTEFVKLIKDDQVAFSSILIDAAEKELLALISFILKSIKINNVQEISEEFWSVVARKSMKFCKKFVNAWEITASDFAMIKLTPGRHTALHEAAERGNYFIVNFLLQHGVDADITDELGNTPLHSATAKHSYEVYQILLNFVDNINAINSEQQTILHKVCQSFNLRAIRLLLHHPDIDVSKQNCYGQTALHLFIQNLTASDISEDTLSILEMLCSMCDAAGCLDTSDANGLTGFDVLLEKCIEEGMKYFKNSASPFCGHTIQFATRLYSQKQTIVRTLLKEFGIRMSHCLAIIPPGHLCDGDVTDYETKEPIIPKSSSALHFFVNQCDFYVVKNFIKNKAVDILATYDNGDTVLHVIAALSVQNKDKERDYIKMAFKILNTYLNVLADTNYTHFTHSERFNMCRFIFIILTRIVTNRKTGHSVLSYAASIGANNYLQFLLHFQISFNGSKRTHFKQTLGNEQCTFLKYTKAIGYYDVTTLCAETMPSLDSRRFDEIIFCLKNYMDVTSSINLSKLANESNQFGQCPVSFTDIIVNIPLSEKKCSKILTISPLHQLVDAYGKRYFVAAMIFLIFHLIYMVSFSCFAFFTITEFLPHDTDRFNNSFKAHPTDTSCDTQKSLIVVAFIFLIYPIICIIVRCFMFIKYIRHKYLPLGHTTPRVVFSSTMNIIYSLLFFILMLVWCLLALFCQPAQPYVLSPCLGCGWLLTTIHMTAIKQLHIFTNTLSEVLLKNVSYFLAFFSVFVVAFCCTIHALVAFPPELFDVSSALYEPVYIAAKFSANLCGFLDANSLNGDDNRKAFLQYTYFGFSFITAIILLNILIAMMSESYGRVVALQRQVWIYDNLHRAVILQRAFPQFFGWQSVFSMIRTNGNVEAVNNKSRYTSQASLVAEEFNHRDDFKFYHLEWSETIDYADNHQSDHIVTGEQKLKAMMKQLDNKMMKLENKISSLVSATNFKNK